MLEPNRKDGNHGGMLLDNCDYNDDYEFSMSTIPAWKVYLQDFFGPTLIEMEFKYNKSIQRNYWDVLLIFSGSRHPMRIEIKSRRWDSHSYYLQYHDRIIETMGNEQLNKLGSSIYNVVSEYFGTGFYDGEKMVDVIIFKPKPVADKIKELLK